MLSGQLLVRAARQPHPAHPQPASPKKRSLQARLRRLACAHPPLLRLLTRTRVHTHPRNRSATRPQATGWRTWWRATRQRGMTTTTSWPRCGGGCISVCVWRGGGERGRAAPPRAGRVARRQAGGSSVAAEAATDARCLLRALQLPVKDAAHHQFSAPHNAHGLGFDSRLRAWKPACCPVARCTRAAYRRAQAKALPLCYLCAPHYLPCLALGPLTTIIPHLAISDTALSCPAVPALQALADRLAEALAEKLHELTRREYWGYAPNEQLSVDDMLKVKYQVGAAREGREARGVCVRGGGGGPGRQAGSGEAGGREGTGQRDRAWGGRTITVTVVFRLRQTLDI